MAELSPQHMVQENHRVVPTKYPTISQFAAVLAGGDVSQPKEKHAQNALDAATVFCSDSVVLTSPLCVRVCVISSRVAPDAVFRVLCAKYDFVFAINRRR